MQHPLQPLYINLLCTPYYGTQQVPQGPLASSLSAILQGVSVGRSTTTPLLRVGGRYNNRHSTVTPVHLDESVNRVTGISHY